LRISADNCAAGNFRFVSHRVSPRRDREQPSTRSLNSTSAKRPCASCC
jgi:hypothetical protein